MELILLERVEKLGQMGDVVNVRAGYARNFLLPQKKALRATKGNVEQFGQRRTQLEAVNLQRRGEAEAVGAKMAGVSVVVLRQASESAQLYGSVSTRDVADALREAGFTVDKRQVQRDRPIKTLGLHPLRIALHPEVIVEIAVNVARSAEEAERQARGEQIIRGGEEEIEEEEEEEEFFEEAADSEEAAATEESEAARD